MLRVVAFCIIKKLLREIANYTTFAVTPFPDVLANAAADAAFPP